MLLQDKQSGTLVEILDIQTLVNPVEKSILGQIQEGEEEQEPEHFDKQNLVFPSGENLPKCWLDAEYQLERN